VKIAADDTSPEADEVAGDGAESARPAPRRRGKPRIAEDAPRERHVLDPGGTCPECGGEMRIVELFRRGQKPQSHAPPRRQAA